MDQANPMEFDNEPVFKSRDSDPPRGNYQRQRTNQDVPMSGYDQPVDFSQQLRGGSKPTAAFVGNQVPKQPIKKVMSSQPAPIRPKGPTEPHRSPIENGQK
jgi:hypothetical protein